MSNENILKFIKKFKNEYTLEQIFEILINCFLISKIRTSESDGDDILRNVYPFAFGEINFDYDSKEALEIINFFSNSEEKRAYYNKFKFVIDKKKNNKFNLSMFFIENSLDLLKKDGKLSFILDISFFEDAYIDIRKYLLDNYTIEKITTNISGFENVASNQIILNVANKKNISNNTLEYYDYLQKEGKKFNQNIWYNNSKYNFLPPLNGIQKDIIDTENSKRSPENVTIEVLKDTITNKTAEILITDNNEEQYGWGVEFRVEQKVNEEWKELDYISDNLSWIEIAYLLDENNQLKMKVNFEKYYGTLENGTYRIVKPVYDNIYRDLYSNEFEIK